MTKTFREWNVNQSVLFPPNVMDLVPEGHVARFPVTVPVPSPIRTPLRLFPAQKLRDFVLKQLLKPDLDPGSRPVLESLIRIR